MNRYAPCPCHSNLNYQKCCRPYHIGEVVPPNASVLMRTRYCAYALCLVNYIMATTHPENSEFTDKTEEWKETIRNFSKATQFKGLEITDHTENGNSSTVTFKAKLMQGLDDASFTERSLFEKIDNRWLYKDGEIIEGTKDK